MYEKIKNDIAQEYYVKNYPNDGQRFIAWYLRNIHNLDTFEAKACITDGAGDKQIDAVYIDDQSSTIYIIQGKFYKGDTVDAEPLREVTSSWIQIKNLAKLQEAANEKLQAKISEIATALEDDYEVCFELITTSGLTDSAKSDLAAFQTELAESETLSANLVLVDNETLQARYDEALNRNRPYINYEFSIEQGKYMEMQIGATRAVIAAIPLKECIKIPGIKDGTLFRKNVRQSLGTGNKVNKGIARTLRNNPEEFFFLHNAKLREAAMLDVIHSATDAKRVLMRNFSQNMYHITEHSQKSDFQMMLDFKGEKDISRKAIDAFQALVYITNSVQTECEGYAMLGEYEPCKECLEEFKSFILENRLNERDTLLLLNENSSQKRIEVVDQFTDIAARITAFDPKAHIEYSVHNLLTAETEHTGGDSDEQ